MAAEAQSKGKGTMASKALPPSVALKSLNTKGGPNRFVYKSFHQLVSEIDINVFRSLEELKSEPSTGASFFRDCLIEWRELNTAANFISFYREMMPAVPTLPQVILHRENIFSNLLSHINMEARLSLEPILMLVSALSRDLLEDFIPFLPRLTDKIVDLLNDGGDHDPEILEQVMTSWSYVMMYLQKYLVKDINLILKITVRLRYYPKNYVQEFMAEAISFLLRNAPVGELLKGLRLVIIEVAKSSSSTRTDGAIALLWHVMRGTSGMLHSRAEKVLRFLIGKSTFTITENIPQGYGVVVELVNGTLSRLCSELSSKEMPKLYNCLFDEINVCISCDCQDLLGPIINFLSLTISHDKQKRTLDIENVLKLVKLLINKYAVVADSAELNAPTSTVLSSTFLLMARLIDIPLNEVNLARVALIYSPAFQSKSIRLLDFIKELLVKDIQILHVFGCHIMCAMENFLETSLEDVVYIVMTYYERRKEQNKLRNEQRLIAFTNIARVDNGNKLRGYFQSKFSYWTKMLDDMSKGCFMDDQLSEKEAAVLWGAIRVFPAIMDLHLDVSLLKDLIPILDKLASFEAGNLGGLSGSAWESLLGTALVSYNDCLPNSDKASEICLFMLLATRYKCSPHVLPAVADYLDSLTAHLDSLPCKLSIEEAFLQVGDSNAANFSITSFAESLSNHNRVVRLSALKLLAHYVRSSLNEEHPHKKQKVDNFGAGRDYSTCSNVVDLLLEIEATPFEQLVSTGRRIIILISRMQMLLSSGAISDEFLPLLFHGILGIFHIRFRDLWQPGMECLAALIRKHKDIVWNDLFLKYLGTHLMKNVVHHIASPNAEYKLPQNLLQSFTLHRSPYHDCTPHGTIVVLLLQSLQKIPDIVESHSRDIVPLFLTFMGYDDGAVQNIESYAFEKCHGKEWTLILKEWLSLFVLMRNPLSLYKSSFLHEVLIKRVLDEPDRDTQGKVLECLMNWKDAFLHPYIQHIRNLVAPQNLREELTTWAVSRESESVKEEHRSSLVPIIIRLLTPTLTNMKALGSRKQGLTCRKAVLRFLLQCDPYELELFFSLLLKSVLPRPVWLDLFCSESEMIESSFVNFIEKSAMITLDGLPWNKLIGFLHLLEEIFCDFDIMHVSPYLNGLMAFIVRILDDCMKKISNKSSEDEDSSLCTEACGEETIKGGSSEVHISIDKLKELRTMCISLFSLALTKYENHTFSADMWDIFFTSVECLIDSLDTDNSRATKPNVLFQCFMIMSRSKTLAKQMGRGKIVPKVISVITLSAASEITVASASDAVISASLEFVENLLRVDDDLAGQDTCSLNKLVVTHVNVLVQSLNVLVHSQKETSRKSSSWLWTKTLNIFKLLTNYIKDSDTADCAIDTSIQYFKFKHRCSDESWEALQVVEGLLPIARDNAARKIVVALGPLLAVAGPELRFCICNIFNCLAVYETSLVLPAKLLEDLNSSSSTSLGEIDYDRRIGAYEAVKPDLFSTLREENATAILSHCVYDMSSEELILRQCASRALQSFLDFANVVLSETNGSIQDMDTSIDALDTKSNSDFTWTHACIHQIIKKNFLPNIRAAMSKDVYLQKEWFSLLRDMVCNLQTISDIYSLRPLCSEDPEEDFFMNITHLQIGRRAKALSFFRQKFIDHSFSKDVTYRIFVPLIFNMLWEVKDGKGEHLRDVCVDTLASITAKMSWKQYRATLSKCFRELDLKQDKQKLLLRLICCIIDNFHFPLDSSDDVKQYLLQTLLPKVLKMLDSDPEKINININLVALKLLKLLADENLESRLSSIIHHICSFLKSRQESSRDEARTALNACLKELGTEYLHFVVKILRAVLKKGYELHVLGYTLHSILVKNINGDIRGKIDDCVEDLISVIESDILGDVSEEKEVEKYASKMKETKNKKSFDSLKLISENIEFKTHASKLLSPIFRHLHGHLTPKVKGKLEMMLRHIALGFECNRSAESSDLFKFVYWKIEETSTTRCTTTTLEASNGYTEKDGEAAVTPDMRNSHLITEFALRLFRERLKRIKLDKGDKQLLSMLDPFVSLLGTCLNSRFQNVITAAFRCLTPLLHLPLPSLEFHADSIKSSVFDIAQKSGDANGFLMQSCLKLLAELMRGCNISLSDDQLHLLIQLPVFVDLQDNPSLVALSLFKSIVHRRLVFHEIYDMTLRIAELMVTSQSEPIRKHCSQILLQFLLDYPLSEKRLQQHIDFLLTNLSYELPSGREAVLEMLFGILRKFPQRVIDSQAKGFFLQLVVALANEHDPSVSSLLITVLRKLASCVSKQISKSLLHYSLSWYMGDKKNLRVAAAQVLTLMVEVVKHCFGKDDIMGVLHAVKNILQSSVNSVANMGLNFPGVLPTSYWSDAYHSMLLFEKLLLQFPERVFEQNEIWLLICKCLMHPHAPLRNTSSCLVASYFALVETKRSEGGGSFILVHPSRLFNIAARLTNHLRTELTDDAANNILVQNLVYCIYNLHRFCKNLEESTLNRFWTRLGSPEQECFFDAFELLGSKNAKESFVLGICEVSPTEDGTKGEGRGLQPLLVGALIKRLGKIALQMEDAQMKIVFNCFRKLASDLQEETSQYTPYLLLPVYKVCEGFTGKVVTDESKHLAETVRDGIRNAIGIGSFVEAYNTIRKSLKRKRDTRRQTHKLLAVRNPLLFAKRKLRTAAKQRVHKKRKMVSMKTRKWR